MTSVVIVAVIALGYLYAGYRTARWDIEITERGGTTVDEALAKEIFTDGLLLWPLILAGIGRRKVWHQLYGRVHPAAVQRAADRVQALELMDRAQALEESIGIGDITELARDLLERSADELRARALELDPEGLSVYHNPPNTYYVPGGKIHTADTAISRYYHHNGRQWDVTRKVKP